MKIHYKISHRSGWVALFLAVLTGILGSGCRKLVEVDQPQGTVTTSDAFSTNELAGAVIAGLYSQLMSNSGSLVFSNGGITLYGGLTADEFLSTQGTADELNYPFQVSKIQATNGVTESVMWKPAYKLIYNCNMAIQTLSANESGSVDAKSRTQFIAEAKFIRAFTYFYLINLFGDVPLVLTPDLYQNKSMARTSQALVYAQIEKDLLDAQSVLPTANTISANASRIRASKWAATALLARVYLYEKKWQQAQDQSTAIIGSGAFSLVNNLPDVFNQKSPEAILQFRQDSTVTPFNGVWDEQNIAPLYSWDDLTQGAGAFYLLDVGLYQSLAPYATPKYYFTPQLAAAFENGDARFTNWVRATPTPSIAPYTGITYYYPYKYTLGFFSTGKSPTQYYMVMRLAEQYLIRAEAKAQLGDLSGAAADLKPLRIRAKLGDVPVTTQDAMLSAVAHERQVELFAEWGHRLFDLKRTGKASAVLGAITTKQPWDPNQLLYPLPPNDIVNNPAMTQNPGYTN